jgi:hypothetical protein
MSNEKFIIKDLARANDWVSIYSSSTNTSAYESAVILSNICGFSNWDLMASEITTNKPSAYDERLSKKDLRQRLLEYRKRLVEIHAMDPGFARYIIGHLSPTSDKPLRRFSLDTENMHGPRSDDGLNIADLIDEFGMNDSDSMEKFAKEMLGDSLGEDFDFSNFEDRLRLSGQIHTASWFNILAGLGWKPIDDESYNEKAEFGTPSMYLNDEAHGRIPVYLFAASRTPYDHEDTAANHAMNVSLSNFQSLSNKGDTAYLLWKHPLRKVINGKSYCHLGMMLYQNHWKPALVNLNCTSFGKTFELNETLDSVDSEPSNLVDDHEAVFMSITKHLGGMDEPDAPSTGWKKVEGTSPSGWSFVMIHHEGN